MAEIHVRKRLSGDRNQCPTCGEYFNSTRAFDAHRTGSYGKPLKDGAYAPSKRRCKTVAEMQQDGMVKSSTDWWITRARPVELPIQP